MFDLFKIILVINFFYKLKILNIIKVYNIFHFKFLNLVIINSFLNKKIIFLKLLSLKIKRNK